MQVFAKKVCKHFVNEARSGVGFSPLAYINEREAYFTRSGFNFLIIAPGRAVRLTFNNINNLLNLKKSAITY